MLWVVAGIHGDEYEGIACAREAIQQITPDRGTLVSLPVAHLAAVEAGTRHGPDRRDLNRCFPGRADASATDQLAASLWQAVRGAAGIVTIHSWHRSGYAMPYAEFQRGDTRSAAWAAGMGIPWLEPWDWHPGLLPAVASRSGMLSVEIELGGLGQQSTEMLEVGLDAVRRAATLLGMLDDRLPAPTTPRTARRDTLNSDRAGVVQQLARVGTPVRAGEVIARVMPNDGHSAAPIAARADGVVAIHCTYGAVRAGDPVAVTFHDIENGNSTPWI